MTLESVGFSLPLTEISQCSYPDLSTRARIDPDIFIQVHEGRGLISFGIRDAQIKTSMRYRVCPLMSAVMEKFGNTL